MPVHFLLRDELGRRPSDVALRRRVVSCALAAAGEIDRIEVLVANETDDTARFGDRARRSPSPACWSGAGRSRRDVGEIEVAVERDEDRLAVGRPVIFDDALACRRRARARAASSRLR